MSTPHGSPEGFVSVTVVSGTRPGPPSGHRAERAASRCGSTRTTGTPPRWRGRRHQARDVVRRARNTPRWRGRPEVRGEATTLGWEHPRAGEDDVYIGDPTDLASGTPPRWRGRRSDRPQTPPRWRGRRLPGRLRRRRGRNTPALRGRLVPRARLRPVRGNTPALAGTTGRRSQSPDRTPEHPRAGGDDVPVLNWISHHQGTPPRWRGRPAVVVLTALTIAEHPRAGGDDGGVALLCALRSGTPPRWRGRLRHTGRHRRLAGNTPALAGTTSSTGQAPWAYYKHGTPPRWRGRPHQRRRARRRHRNTPALAGTTRWQRRTARSAPEHPRAGGDDATVPTNRDRWFGTPPRWRGRRLGGQGSDGRAGNTPALAGTTARPGSAASPATEHPRAGGDDDPDENDSTLQTGTPPRWRGRRSSAATNAPRSRNTPALAGTTHRTEPASPSSGEHPRAGGDDTRVEPPCPPLRGTPPRWRGRPVRGPLRRDRLRNTPALAGTTCPTSCEGCRAGNIPALAGTTCPTSCEGCRAGNTPALAGTTTAAAPCSARSWEHPRAGGDDHSRTAETSGRSEHPRAGGDDKRLLPPSSPAHGTAPRWRGRPASRARAHVGRRNTPALAGTTCSRTSRSSVTSEHPRAGGDDAGRTARPRARCGTPPRWRGRPGGVRRRRPCVRNTPALAGTTASTAIAGSAAREHPRAGGDDDDPAAGHHRQVRNTPALAGTTLVHQRLYLRERLISISPSRSTGM